MRNLDFVSILDCAFTNVQVKQVRMAKGVGDGMDPPLSLP